MHACKRILAALTILLCVVGLLLSLTGGVGVWIVKGPTTAKASYVFGRIDNALDVADQGLTHVETSLDKAEERLAQVKAEQRKIAEDPKNNRQRGRVVARTIQESIAPEFDKAHETFFTVAEAAIVVNSVLEDVGSLPFLSVPGLEKDRLTEINSRLSQVESSAWELGRLFGDPEDFEAASAQVSRIEQALKGLRSLLAEYAARVTEVRHRTEELRSRIFTWITPATVIVSFVCFWIGLSQISLMCHAWSWGRIVNSGPSAAIH